MGAEGLTAQREEGRAPSVSTGVQGEEIPSRHRFRVGVAGHSELPAIVDETWPEQFKWSHDRTKVYTTTAVNQHNQYGDLQGPEVPRGACPEHRQLRHSDRLRPTVSGAALSVRLLVVGDNTDQNLLVTETWK